MKNKEKYVTYELSLIQEVMHFLKEVDTNKSKELLQNRVKFTIVSIKNLDNILNRFCGKDDVDGICGDF